MLDFLEKYGIILSEIGMRVGFLKQFPGFRKER